jgi:hypothetical protein
VPFVVLMMCCSRFFEAGLRGREDLAPPFDDFALPRVDRSAQRSSSRQR